MNTYGMRAINSQSFNNKENYTISLEDRNKVITFLKIHNFALTALEYSSLTQFYASTTRVFSGLSMIAKCAYVKFYNKADPILNGKGLDEALLTGLVQVMRGAITLTVPGGFTVNWSLDMVASLYNFHLESENFKNKHNPTAHSEPVYLAPLFLV
ncbi:hypothetical protein BN1013_02089 [Candidatus Rubidus massiliensis]|nr:hypothetical protein BN1013_02089 [Candidatus Rubidus massiliensis]